MRREVCEVYGEKIISRGDRSESDTFTNGRTDKRVQRTETDRIDNNRGRGARERLSFKRIGTVNEITETRGIDRGQYSRKTD